jgi:5-methyltetrahydrofolate--homocysteine methyltransferase
LATLGAIEQIMKQFPGVHTTCGLTNVSYGLPNRKLVNRTFLVAAIVRGLESAILDPTDKQLFGALKATLMIVGKDEFCMQYITSYREGKLE